MKKLRHLYWRYFGQPDVPPQDFPLLPSISEYSLKVYYPKYFKYSIHFRNGYSLEEIAVKERVARERVRQCLWKAYWRYYAR